MPHTTPAYRDKTALLRNYEDVVRDNKELRRKHNALLGASERLSDGKSSEADLARIRTGLTGSIGQKIR